MNIVSYAFSRFVGIDVSKETLDIASAECHSATIGNTRKAINTWINSLLETANTIVVMEATGGYESLLVKLLHERKIALAVVNPRQVRDFAKGIGKNAKTDAIDASHREICRSRATSAAGCSIRRRNQAWRSCSAATAALGSHESGAKPHPADR